jgi:hypothetical protein
LEGQVGVRLPEEYRDFLTEVAAGGAGPAYGLFQVRRVAERWQWEGDGAELADLARLSEEFPIQGPDPVELAAMQEQCPQEEDFARTEEFDEAWQGWEERWGALLWNPERTVGAIVLCHLGCAIRVWLVVSGPERGHLWIDDRACGVDLAPLLGPQQEPVTFASWYRGWLDEASRTATATRRRRRGGRSAR